MSMHNNLSRAERTAARQHGYECAKKDDCACPYLPNSEGAREFRAGIEDYRRFERIANGECPCGCGSIVVCEHERAREARTQTVDALADKCARLETQLADALAENACLLECIAQARLSLANILPSGVKKIT